MVTISANCRKSKNFKIEKILQISNVNVNLSELSNVKKRKCQTRSRRLTFCRVNLILKIEASKRHSNLLRISKNRQKCKKLQEMPKLSSFTINKISKFKNCPISKMSTVKRENVKKELNK